LRGNKKGENWIGKKKIELVMNSTAYPGVQKGAGRKARNFNQLRKRRSSEMSGERDARITKSLSLKIVSISGIQ